MHAYPRHRRHHHQYSLHPRIDYTFVAFDHLDASRPTVNLVAVSKSTRSCVASSMRMSVSPMSLSGAASLHPWTGQPFTLQRQCCSQAGIELTLLRQQVHLHHHHHLPSRPGPHHCRRWHPPSTAPNVTLRRRNLICSSKPTKTCTC